MNLDKRINQITKHANDFYPKAIKSGETNKDIKQLIKEVLEYVKPERVDKFKLIDPYDNPDNLEGFNNATDEMEAKIKELGL